MVLFFMGPLELRAQQVTKVVTVGVLAPSAGRNPIDEAFEQSLQDRGWRRNHNVRIETRYAAGRSDAFAPLAAELVGLGADVLVAWSVPAAAAVKRATSQIPVVFLGAAEPVRFGLVSSLARPGANLTGVSFDVSEDIYVKRLELLKAAVPGLTRVALLVSAGTPRAVDTRRVVAAAKQQLNLDVREIEVRTPADFEAAVLRAKEQRAQGLYVWTHNPFVWGPELSELAIAHRLASIHWFKESAMAGGLLSYAASLTDIAVRGARYVDRILRGARPAELPVEQPTKFELVINVKTAKALGLSIPPSLLLQADAVIE
jgi:putative ABC transport system substrate-binding protein